VAAGVQDINQTSLYFSGLSLGVLAPGGPVTCTFTVSHVRPGTGIELFAAKDTFSGVVLDATTGLVILLMDTATVSLSVGRYVLVRLNSVGSLPLFYGNRPITVEVGPYTLFQAAAIGQPYAPAGILAVTRTVSPGGAGGSAQGAPSGGFSATEGAVVGGLVLAAVAGGYVLVRNRRKRALG
jgi:hypothetical protein